MLLLVLLVSFVLIAYLNRKDPYAYRNPRRRPLWKILAIAVPFSLGITAFVSIFSILIPSVSVTDTGSQRLVAATVGSETHGSFFLGSGSVNSEPAFIYYTNDNGVYYLHSHPASSSAVIQTDSVTPHVEKRCEPSSYVPGWIVWPLNGHHSKTLRCDSEDYYTFYVPVGSITTSYDLSPKG